jgi:hypothetical protein
MECLGLNLIILKKASYFKVTIIGLSSVQSMQNLQDGDSVRDARAAYPSGNRRDFVLQNSARNNLQL